MPSEPIKFSQGKYLLAITTYIMVAAVFVRTYLYYPAVRIPAFSILFVLVGLLVLEPAVISRHKNIWVIYLILQIAIMVALFLLEPDGDTFSLLLLPACMFVMRYYEPITAWIWVGIFSIFMGIMLFFGHQEYAPALIVVYLAAYVLISSFSLVIKQNQIAQQQLMAANKKLRRYSEQVEDLTAVNERSHLARELHDSVTQTIFSMTLITRSTLILQERDPIQVPEKLEELQELAQNALTEMRTLVSQLRPLSISDDGLFPVLEKHVEELKRRNQIDISLDIQNKSPRLNAEQHQEVFRIIQEALNNIVKHSQAQKAIVRFEQTDTRIVVTVSDNGQGFESTVSDTDHFHFGLNSMRQRAQELNGQLMIESTPGSGTKVVCTIPVKEV